MSQLLKLGEVAISAAPLTSYPVSVNFPLSGDGTPSNPISLLGYNSPLYVELWSATTAFKNNYSITLNDTINNYDEIRIYGSANRGSNYFVKTYNDYPVQSAGTMLAGVYFMGQWTTLTSHLIVNGTEIMLSGNSGYVGNSYFFGMNSNATAYAAGRYTTARNEDLHPYRIVGVKY